MDNLVEKISIHLGTVTTDGDPKSWWADRRLRNNEIIELQQFWIRIFLWNIFNFFSKIEVSDEILKCFWIHSTESYPWCNVPGAPSPCFPKNGQLPVAEKHRWLPIPVKSMRTAVSCICSPCLGSYWQQKSCNKNTRSNSQSLFQIRSWPKVFQRIWKSNDFTFMESIWLAAKVTNIFDFVKTCSTVPNRKAHGTRWV